MPADSSGSGVRQRKDKGSPCRKPWMEHGWAMQRGRAADKLFSHTASKAARALVTQAVLATRTLLATKAARPLVTQAVLATRALTSRRSWRLLCLWVPSHRCICLRPRIHHISTQPLRNKHHAQRKGSSHNCGWVEPTRPRTDVRRVGAQQFLGRSVGP